MHGDLPRTEGVRRPRTWALQHLAGASRGLVGRRWDVEVRGAEHFPTHGPVIVAGNHTGWVDGPLMAIFAPRPLHALTKTEMFASPPMAAFLRWAGQVPMHRFEVDPLALKTSVAVLRAGGAVGIFPEGTRGDGSAERARGGVGWLALVTGAPVLPVAFLGTRVPGGTMGSVPPAGSRFVIEYAEPLRFAARPWPRRRADVAAVTEQVREALARHVSQARRRTGIASPGPVPRDVTEDEEEQ
ncbi:1-acyl-sn-glycerol-3-phosphate acyltransferase [Marmoricola endophyticus]|uniref:1-acyl-sn-glycerol-3-phosphate acyltransferase n=1 Tax=Marmoricola endophyticus TaxID=2040280 RepID=A0A917EYU4_9ACTN|nr:lysophospholipid acyltransferase family protein [Marmoricola endophyticus]GGF35164.1 1-acyl-sn-glycerol-3-phosphate acyltransferase [Marmoricola endophyticus]